MSPPPQFSGRLQLVVRARRRRLLAISSVSSSSPCASWQRSGAPTTVRGLGGGFVQVESFLRAGGSNPGFRSRSRWGRPRLLFHPGTEGEATHPVCVPIPTQDGDGAMAAVAPPTGAIAGSRSAHGEVPQQLLHSSIWQLWHLHPPTFVSGPIRFTPTLM